MARKIIVVTLLVAGVILASVAAVPMQAITNFTNVTLSGDLVVGDDARVTDDLTTADLIVTGGSNLTGNVDVTGNLEVVDHFANSGQTYYITGSAYTVTNGGTITPTETVVELTAAGTVGAGLSTASDGQLVIFINTANQTITITDTTGVQLAGDWAGGQNDTLTLIGQGVTWYELDRSTN